MRLAIFGLTITSAWGNGHATHNRALVRALARRGHRVRFYERDQPFYAAHRDLRQLAGVEVVVYRDWPSIRCHALAHARNCDAVITTSYCADGAAIHDDLFQAPHPRCVFCDLDTPVTLDGLAAQTISITCYLKPEHVPCFDLYLSFTGGPALAEIAARWGARRVMPFFLCVDPAVHHAAPVSPQFASRLGYLGTFSPDRQPALRELLLAPARRLPGASFTLAGPMFPASEDWPRNLRRWSHLSPGAHAAFFSGADFALNLTRAPMLRFGFSPQGRIFEAVCCGTPVITDCWPGLEAFFEPGREIVAAKDADDVARALRDHSARQRRRMAWRARRRALAEHGADRRAHELETLLAN